MQGWFKWCSEYDYPYLEIRRASDLTDQHKNYLNGNQLEESGDSEDENSSLNDKILMMGHKFTDINWMLVYHTDAMYNELNPTFEAINTKMSEICHNDRNSLLKFSVKRMDKKDSSNHRTYGSFTTTATQLENIAQHHIFDLRNEKGEKKGILKFKHFAIIEQYSFTDYLKSGWKINMSVAIDFTASNGEPSEKNSLHRINEDGALNQY
jgi:hypothetical protein